LLCLEIRARQSLKGD